LFELIKEGTEKANAAGVTGTPSDVYYKITPDMLQAKMEQKKEQDK
jgi:hypothetical protein